MARELAAPAHEGATWAESLRADTVPAIDEAALVQAARKDPVAVGQLYDRYVDRVYWYARTRTATAEDAQDLTQQIFMQMIAALPRYRPDKAPFAAWL